MQNHTKFEMIILKYSLENWLTKRHCVKIARIRSYLVCIQSECGKIRTRKTPNMDTFHAVMDIQEIFGIKF